MDVVDEVPFTNIKPRIVDYQGGDVVLNEKLGIVLSSKDFPEMADCVGKHIIVTDGTTLLGADDKNGVAEIITAAEELLAHPVAAHTDSILSALAPTMLIQWTATPSAELNMKHLMPLMQKLNSTVFPFTPEAQRIR